MHTSHISLGIQFCVLGSYGTRLVNCNRRTGVANFELLMSTSSDRLRNTVCELLFLPARCTRLHGNVIGRGRAETLERMSQV
jgi:hypothetical protein